MVSGGQLGRPLGRSMGAFQTRVDSRSDPMLDEIANLQGAGLQRLVTPSTGPERVAQQTPRYQSAQAAAQTFGYEETGQRGPVASLFDFLMRGQSAVMGAGTGFVGAQRAGDEITRGGFGEAARRFGEGISGREQYRFSDFTSTGRRIAEGEDVGTGARVWNTALGFVIDTATDPLTYISFGGSILGRMRAANVIRGKSAGAVGQAGARNEAREQLMNGIGRADFNEEAFIRNALSVRATRTDKLAFDLNRRAAEIAKANPSLAESIGKNPFATTASIDDILRTNQSLFASTKKNILRELAPDIAPDVAAMAYARRSSAGLRRWAKENLGEEAGEAYFKALPQDIQGGLRIRLPFVRNADGTPLAFGVQGVGAGRMGDASPFVRRIEDMTQSGRDVFRELFEPVLSKISGKSGAIYYDAVIAATGRKVRTSKGTDGSTWVDYSFSNYADANRRELRTVFDERFIKEHEVTSQLYKNANEKYGNRFGDSFRRYMYSNEELQAGLAARGTLSDADEAALNAANSWRRMLDELGQDALEVFEDAGMAFHFLADYVPRIMNNNALAQAKLAKKRGVSPRPGYTKHREQWASQWELSQEGTAYVIKWMPNEDIARINPNVFETDPTVWMSVYLAELRSSLNDQKIINMLRRNGMLTAAQLEKYADINEGEISRRMVELVGDGVNRDASRIARVEKILARYAPLEGDEFAAVAEELRSVGVNFIRREDVSNYIQADDIWKNIIDGSEIRQLANGRWQVFDKTGRKLRHNNRVTEQGLVEVGTTGQSAPLLEFDSFAQAKNSWDNYQIVNREGMWQRQYLPDEFERLVKDVTEINSNPMFAADRINQFVGLSELEKADFVEGWMNALARFDMDGYELVLTQSGQPAFARGMGNRNLVSQQERMAPQFAEWLGSGEYMNIQGVRFDEFGEPTIASQAIIKQKIAEQMANEYAPAKFMQAIQRMFEAAQAPQTAGAKLYNDYYKPIYAAQKAWMTLGRGPGFVIRNTLGGTWNNWIVAVGREHNLKSAAIVRATRVAQVDVRKSIEKLGTEVDPTQIGELYREAVRKQLSKSYSGQELDNLLEAWYLFSRNGLAGNRETARLYGELYRSVAGRGTRQPTARLRDQDFRVQEASGASGRYEVLRDEDMSRVERFLEMAAGDNWWIRDFMAPKVELSEDYMRFAAFLKGIDEVGLEPDSFVRGYAASQFVKTTQFDYADLSDVEQTLKMFVPFYTWTRYNVPLQIRAIIHEPGKVAQALRIHESLGAMFGEEPDALSPSYVADRFGITIPEESPLLQMLPEWMRPKGDVTLGLTWGEPLSDVNQLFRDPFYAAQVGGLRGLAKGGFVNAREVAQQFNPIIAAASAAQQALGEAGRMDGRNVEEAPRWARALGLAREDPTEPGTFVSNRSVLEAIRATVPLAGQLERVIPYLGSERHEGRWTTSVISALFGLPVSTIDDWKRASEMDRRATFVQEQMKAEFGPAWAYRNEMIRRLTAEGASPDFIAALNLRDFGDNEVDVLRAVYTWRMMRRVEMLIENGVPEEEIVAALSAFAPEGSKVESLVQLIWNYVPKPPGDFETGVRQFGLQPITRRDLQELGLTTNDVRNMTEDEQRNLVYWVNRNKGWTGKR
jgi:DNA-binding Lrp family transcriptional regulator